MTQSGHHRYILNGLIFDTFARQLLMRGLPMSDPIQRESSSLDWIRRNRLEAFRRLVVWSMLVGVLLYIYGEILSLDWAIQTGIWLLLAGIAAAMFYKLVTFVVEFLGK